MAYFNWGFFLELAFLIFSMEFTSNSLNLFSSTNSYYIN